MNTLDKVYNLTIDIKNIDVKYNSYAKFFDDDRETSVIRIKLLNDKTPMNLENCIVEAYFILADNTYHNEACKIINSSEGVVELQLCQKCLVKGENIVRLSILKDNEISNTPVIIYEVRKGLYSDNPSFNDDPLTPILSQMLLDIKVTKVNQIELQERYEKSLPKIEGKIKEVESLINRVDTVIASGTQDLEVIDARDGEVSLKARLDRDLYKDGISLSDRIEAIEGLKDSQNMKYETDKGYLVCQETKNGVIDDLKIEGKTLVNLTTTASLTFNKVSNIQKINTTRLGEQYNTLIFNVDNINENSSLDIRQINSEGTMIVSLGYAKVGLNIVKFKLEDTTTHIGFRSNSTFNGTTNITNIMLLEGDHTQNPPSYFEGLMSVGEDVDEIEVLSCNENLLNLVDLGYTQKGQYLNIEYMNANSIKFNTLSKNPTPYASVSFDSFKFIPNIRYRLKAKCTQGNSMNRPFISIRQYENYGSGLKDIYAVNGVIEGTFIPTHTNHRIDIYGGNHNGPLGGTWVEYTDIQLSIDNSDFNYFTTHQSDKKQILFYNENGELEPIQELREWDSIEKHSDNKWYYHKRSGKVVLNGSESDTIEMYTDGAHYLQFNFKFDKHNLNDYKALSDRFVNVRFTNQYDSECFSMHSQKLIVFKILKSKLSTQDVAGFKQWLQANNVTVVYQLEEEEVYEIAPLHLDSYANETLILCNSGAISPKMEFSITSHINKLVKAYGERINLLEEKVYQYMVTQNRMQLASTYSADSVTFKVDYFSLCGDEENYDEDLYNLILNNILVGKDNYDYDKMFTMILDYASWNQISWEQFDILVGLMDIQHNPPVEELPTEDGIEEDIIENEETPVE